MNAEEFLKEKGITESCFQDFGVMDTMIKSMEEYASSQWISVDDGLPELEVINSHGSFSNPVLALHSDGHHEDCMLNEGIDSDNPYWSFVQDDEFTETVTHWQPLPNPPKK